VLELANEPYHSSQARLDDPVLMRRLQKEVPGNLLVAWGAADEDTSDEMSGGSYVVVHLARAGERWSRVANMRELASLSQQLGKPVIDNEPIGAAEAEARDRRDASPAAFFAQGALSRILEVGSTFHCEDCLLARVPGLKQEQAAVAFIEGTQIIPDDVTVTYRPAHTVGSPVSGAVKGQADERLFPAVAGSRAWVVVLGGTGETAITWTAGWRSAGQTARWPGVEVWSATR
jgi:hypothetical protein